MLFGRLRLKRSDPESLAASCGRHKVQPAAAAASCGRHKVQSEPAAASCGRHKVQSEAAAASCGRHKVQPATAASSCGRHKVRSAACGGVVWSPQSAASDLRRRYVVATYRQRPLPSSFRSSFLGSTYLYFSYYIPYIYTRERAVSPASRRRRTILTRSCPGPSCSASYPCCRGWCAGQRQLPCSL